MRGVAHESSVAGMSPKLAIVTFLCNGSDHHGFGWADQLLRAHRLGLSVSSLATSKFGADVDRIAVTYNYGYPEVTLKTLTTAGWRVWNASHIPQESFALRPIFHDEPDARLHWPRSRHTRVQRRPDFNCTSLKLLAWNLTQYDRVMVSDTDVCMLEDPVPWMLRHQSEYFVATPQGLDRPYQGISSHFMYLQPSELVFRMLRDSATTRSFIPYTNSEQVCQGATTRYLASCCVESPPHTLCIIQPGAAVPQLCRGSLRAPSVSYVLLSRRATCVCVCFECRRMATKASAHLKPHRHRFASVTPGFIAGHPRDCLRYAARLPPLAAPPARPQPAQLPTRESERLWTFARRCLAPVQYDAPPRSVRRGAPRRGSTALRHLAFESFEYVVGLACSMQAARGCFQVND